MRFARSANLAREGYDCSPATPIRILLASQEANAAALLGDLRRARAALVRAERAGKARPPRLGRIGLVVPAAAPGSVRPVRGHPRPARSQRTRAAQHCRFRLGQRRGRPDTTTRHQRVRRAGELAGVGGVQAEHGVELDQAAALELGDLRRVRLRPIAGRRCILRRRRRRVGLNAVLVGCFAQRR
jgi:hypothetical protein